MTLHPDTRRVMEEHGLAVFVIPKRAKAPPEKDWQRLATTDADVLEARAPENCNFGIHPAQNIIITDEDEAGALLGLELEYGDLPPTLEFITARGLPHRVYRLPPGHPGVPNSVGKVAPKVDIRTRGGYVVAPGSRTEKGEYRIARDVPIADAPEWLVSRLGQIAPKPERIATVPDADAATIQRAAAWLAGRPGAVEGQGGDAYTFATAAFLRDYGLSEGQTFTLMAEGWNDRCSPPWDITDLASKIKNAYSYGTGTPGAKAVTAEDFPLLPESSPNVPDSGTTPAAPRAGAVRLADLATRRVEGPGYLVKGLLSRASYAEIYGPPGSGKTFMALDIAYNVAAGSPWMDRKVRQGPALYLAYEGMGGLVKRAQALRQKYGNADVPLYVVAADYNLRDKPGRQALGSVIAALPEKPALIVIDTFARALMGGDENSAQDVGAFNSAVAALIESTGACVVILHHTGKDKGRGARGSSALQGAVDTEISVDGRMLLPTKQRDIELGNAIGFRLTPVMVGLDEDDDDLTSCVVDAAPLSEDTGGIELQGNQKRGWEALVNLSPNNEPVTLAAWRAACAEFLGTSRAGQRFYDIRTRLEGMKLVVVEDGMVTRRME